MADKKTTLMASFYEQCQQKGYTDMSDDKQSLKAKVIATDLKLNYGNIESFYEKAKICYAQVQTEEAEAEKQRQLQKQKDEEEAARRAVDGVLLVTLSDYSYETDNATVIRVYMRPDKSEYYTVNDGSKQEGVPEITVEKAGALMLTYHPSQAVYTGATVGGVTTGGVHYTDASYSARTTNNGKGDLRIKFAGREFVLAMITMSDFTCEKFKRDHAFQVWVIDRQVKCFAESAKADFFTQSALSSYSGSGGISASNYHTTINALGMAADERRLSYNTCVKILNLLGRVVHCQFPPSDEELYASADRMAKAANSEGLKQAEETFQSISDYKDAAKRAQEVHQTYEEVLQTEKEQAILEKEARNKRSKKLRIRLVLIACAVAFVVAVVGTVRSISAKKYADRMIPLVTNALADTVWLHPRVAEYDDEIADIFKGSSYKIYPTETEDTYFVELMNGGSGYVTSRYKDSDATVYKFTDNLSRLHYKPSEENFEAWDEFDLEALDTWDAPKEYKFEVVKIKSNVMVLKQENGETEYEVSFSERDGRIVIESITFSYSFDMSGLFVYSPEHRAVTALEDLEFRYSKGESEFEMIRIVE